jgi:hypothetical protein
MNFGVGQVLKLVGKKGLGVLRIFLREVEEMVGVDYGNGRYFDYVGLQSLQQQVLDKTKTTLSSAKSLGRKSVTRFPMMWPS